MIAGELRASARVAGCFARHHEQSFGGVVSGRMLACLTCKSRRTIRSIASDKPKEVMRANYWTRLPGASCPRLMLGDWPGTLADQVAVCSGSGPLSPLNAPAMTTSMPLLHPRVETARCGFGEIALVSE